MNSDVTDFMATMEEAYAKQKKQQKSDDIIGFIKAHWSFFCSRRTDMTNAVEMLGSQVAYTVDALCDQLGIPDNVFFKRSPVVDVSGAILNFERSKLMELFVQCCASSKNGEACLFVVSGKKSIIITNMQTSFYPGAFIMYFKSLGEMPDIHVFGVEDAPKRLPNLFDHKD